MATNRNTDAPKLRTPSELSAPLSAAEQASLDAAWRRDRHRLWGTDPNRICRFLPVEGDDQPQADGYDVIHLHPETAAELRHRAESCGINPADLVQDWIEHRLQYHTPPIPLQAVALIHSIRRAVSRIYTTAHIILTANSDTFHESEIGAEDAIEMMAKQQVSEINQVIEDIHVVIELIESDRRVQL